MKWKQGDTVYAKHTDGLLYPAKVKKTNADAAFVHYSGWNIKWDEWVKFTALLPPTDETKQLAVKLLKQAKARKNKVEGNKRKKKGGTSKKGKKRKVKKGKKVDDSVVPEEERRSKKMGIVQIKVPGALKRRLLIDWENVTRQKHLLKLPCSTTVRDILDAFLLTKTKNPKDMQLATEVMTGLRNFFDRVLGSVLLYRFERPQYQETRAEHEGKEASEIYGAEHFSRLFVKLPDILKNLDMEAKKLVLSQTTAFLRWFASQDALFSGLYMPCDPEYFTKLRELEETSPPPPTEAEEAARVAAAAAEAEEEADEGDEQGSEEKKEEKEETKKEPEPSPSPAAGGQ